MVLSTPVRVRVQSYFMSSDKMFRCFVVAVYKYKKKCETDFWYRRWAESNLYFVNWTPEAFASLSVHKRWYAYDNRTAEMKIRKSPNPVFTYDTSTHAPRASVLTVCLMFRHESRVSEAHAYSVYLPCSVSLQADGTTSKRDIQCISGSVVQSNWEILCETGPSLPAAFNNTKILTHVLKYKTK